MNRYDIEFKNKQEFMEDVLSSYYEKKLDCFKSQPTHYRMRAEFRIWHDGDSSYHIMFDKETKTKYRVDQLDAAHPSINDAMLHIIKAINSSPILRSKLFQVDYLVSTTNNIVISLIYHKPITETWIKSAEELKISMSQFNQVGLIGRAKKQKVVIGQDYVMEALTINKKRYVFKQVENSFTQPNASINEQMVSWVCNNAPQTDFDMLELYCGSGNFSIPLCQQYRQVLGTEISKSAVEAAQHNIKLNAVRNLKIARLSSEEFVQAYRKVRKFNRLAEIDLEDYAFATVLVDPPRAGLDNETLELVSNFENIIYISCNPNTLNSNLEYLSNTHNVTKAAFFDQFPLTPHIESGVILSKRNSP